METEMALTGCSVHGSAVLMGTSLHFEGGWKGCGNAAEEISLIAVEYQIVIVRSVVLVEALSSIHVLQRHFPASVY